MLDLLETELENERRKDGKKTLTFKKAMAIKKSAEQKLSAI